MRTLYIGVTNELVRRVYEHKNDLVEGFTKKYGIHLLVYYEQYNNDESAIQRERQMKKWNPQLKIEQLSRKSGKKTNRTMTCANENMCDYDLPR